jgi:hypothetical protein
MGYSPAGIKTISDITNLSARAPSTTPPVETPVTKTQNNQNLIYLITATQQKT